ncbi:hypothetical protein SAMN02745674_02146 [Lysobacter spongiicola DSM 21749]|uniref:Uncharacterized protein n=1 Tax=Lysobacter spongiicola DSM 21749 TaxID=1122188 RepID=A0A1T4RF93_9GAMM|nr:hypothetical protein SAMN02745674_02146 [Lysobacter spongiicola DSM 21749]
MGTSLGQGDFGHPKTDGDMQSLRKALHQHQSPVICQLPKVPDMR